MTGRTRLKAVLTRVLNTTVVQTTRAGTVSVTRSPRFYQNVVRCEFHHFTHASICIRHEFLIAVATLIAAFTVPPSFAFTGTIVLASAVLGVAVVARYVACFTCVCAGARIYSVDELVHD